MRHFAAQLGTIQAQQLHAACEALLSFSKTVESGRRCLSETECEAAVKAILNHNVLFRASGGTLVPKHHLAVHLAEQMRYSGNVKFSSSYPDETLNHVFAKIARSAQP